MGTLLSITNELLREAEPAHPQRKKIRRSSGIKQHSAVSVKTNGKTARSRWKNFCY